MRINRLTISNISSFEGESTIDFSVIDKSKNIILVGGKNGAGKSSLFLAMKLALYGPLTFNYQSVNPIYITRIKDLINHNAYSKSKVIAYSEIEISLYEERTHVDYKIRRNWELINKKLHESVYIYKQNELLNPEQINFFLEYLNTVLPVNLFNLYFFDGERIDEMFEGLKYNNFIKKSLLTLYSVDVFEVLRKYLDNYVVKTKGDEELEHAQEEFGRIIYELEEHENRIKTIEEEIDTIQKEIDYAEIELKNEEGSFHKAGGLTKQEQESISAELLQHEKIKNENNLKLKSFVEDLMPFVICGEFSGNIKSQLELEADVKRFELISNEFTPEFTSSILVESISELDFDFKNTEKINELSNIVYNKIFENLKPNNNGNFKILHDLSSDQKDRVISTINRVFDFKSNEVVSNIMLKEKAQKSTKALNKKLRNSLNETDVAAFMKKINNIENNILDLKRKSEKKESEYEEYKEKIKKLEFEKLRIKEGLKSKTQQSNVYDISEKLSQMMNKLVQEVSRSKFNELEQAFLLIFKKIMRKDNIIDFIKIDDDFSLNLYQEQQYRLSELSLLIANLGYEGFIDRIGDKGKHILYDYLSVENDIELQAELKLNSNDINIKLYKKIGLGQLSKGEKQIFTLSLYWAMIKIVDHEIPFIIDTPYARIDTQHRDQITQEFFTTISDQVIILSTDEEINEQYYNSMRSSIAHEYLLLNDKDENKTTVKEGYFFRG